MNRTIETVLSIGNLYFVLIILATIFFAYLIAIVLNSVVIVIEERRPRLLWLTYAILSPFLMFVLNIGYGIGFHYLTLPTLLKISLEPSISIILVINIGWFFVNILPALLLKIVKKISLKTAKVIRIIVALSFGSLIILLFYNQHTALISSLVFTIIFFFIIQQIKTAPAPKIVEKPVIPKKLVITHIYISTAESHEKVREAVNLIQEAITEIPDTGDMPQVALSGFIPNALDILIKYYILKAEKMDEIKDRVNLNIIKKLNEKNIKLSSA